MEKVSTTWVETGTGDVSNAMYDASEALRLASSVFSGTGAAQALHGATFGARLVISLPNRAALLKPLVLGWFEPPFAACLTLAQDWCLAGLYMATLVQAGQVHEMAGAAEEALHAFQEARHLVGPPHPSLCHCPQSLDCMLCIW